MIRPARRGDRTPNTDYRVQCTDASEKKRTRHSTRYSTRHSTPPTHQSWISNESQRRLPQVPKHFRLHELLLIAPKGRASYPPPAAGHISPSLTTWSTYILRTHRNNATKRPYYIRLYAIKRVKGRSFLRKGRAKSGVNAPCQNINAKKGPATQ